LNENEERFNASDSIFKKILSGSFESAEVMDKQQRCCHLFKRWFLAVSIRAVLQLYLVLAVAMDAESDTSSEIETLWTNHLLRVTTVDFLRRIVSEADTRRGQAGRKKDLAIMLESVISQIRRIRTSYGRQNSVRTGAVPVPGTSDQVLYRTLRSGSIVL
jgi:hypothetical protein